jgi:hypothetical protein
MVSGAGDQANQRIELQNKTAAQKAILDMEMEARGMYEARVHERTRTEQAQDYERNKADSIAAEGRAYEREKGLIGMRKDPNQAKLTALQLQQAESELKVPKAVSMEYDALKKRNETISSSLYKAQAEGSYDPTTAAKAEADMESNTMRMRELLQPYQGDAAPKPSKGGIDDLFPRIEKPAPKSVETTATQKPKVASNLTGEQARTKARELISNLDTRDQMSKYNTRKALDALPQEFIGALRKEAGI